jgi:hypothetical protein
MEMPSPDESIGWDTQGQVFWRFWETNTIALYGAFMTNAYGMFYESTHKTMERRTPMYHTWKRILYRNQEPSSRPNITPQPREAQL